MRRPCTPSRRLQRASWGTSTLRRHRAQPIGDEFAGSSITVPTGADGVPGLANALKSHTQDVRK
ncbi:hypothetical protein LUTEI9C_100020 [Luteimonas sp. 9C]|nr:hypothetical protein LUTEI9C_100020 [Luteimonas sp. 9C]